MKATILIAAFLFTLAACAKSPDVIPANEEQALDTDGTIQRYHLLLEDTEKARLNTPGFIIGIEKSPRASVGFVGDGHPVGDISAPVEPIANTSQQDVVAQQGQFRRVLNDYKVTYVSHVLRYDGRSADAELRHSAYSLTAYGETPTLCSNAEGQTIYQQSRSALTCLQSDIRGSLNDAKSRGTPHTHIFLMSMGWNNDQIESVERYNAIVTSTKNAAEQDGRAFNPLVVGLTWPSVWGGNSPSDVLNGLLHISSYPVRSSDADEIGYVAANTILNEILPDIETEFGLRTIVIGHSFGARILTRAYYSAHLLSSHNHRPAGNEPLLVGLQPAFSANRYASNHKPFPLLRIFAPAEGGPYQNHRLAQGPAVFTWSTEDEANPVAQFVTGAKHIGGVPGAQRAQKINDVWPGRIHSLVWPTSFGGNGSECNDQIDNASVRLVNASTIIRDHGDIKGAGVGNLIWRMMRCY